MLLVTFIAKFGWPEFWMTLLTSAIIFGIHGWKKIKGLFVNEEDKEKKPFNHTEE